MTDSDNDADGLYTDGANAWASSRGRIVIQSYRDAATVAYEVRHVFYNTDEYPDVHSLVTSLMPEIRATAIQEHRSHHADHCSCVQQNTVSGQDFFPVPAS